MVEFSFPLRFFLLLLCPHLSRINQRTPSELPPPPPAPLRHIYVWIRPCFVCVSVCAVPLSPLHLFFAWLFFRLFLLLHDRFGVKLFLLLPNPDVTTSSLPYVYLP